MNEKDKYLVIVIIMFIPLILSIVFHPDIMFSSSRMPRPPCLGAFA